ncbi:MAG: type II toxin-antitoxin system PemK/MazF family toxin, partial [Planctomycetota bacterium]
ARPQHIVVTPAKGIPHFDISDTYAAQDDALAMVWDDPERDVYDNKDSVVTCKNLVTVAQDRVTRTIGPLPDDLLAQINDCLKASLAIS